jgi:hypothetical protein
MSNYLSYYDAIKASTTLWKPANNFQSYTSSSTKYPVSSGGSSGLVMLDGASTANLAGVEAVSESIGYSLLLAAQYNDKTTFDRISAFIQTAMKASGKTLMPWEVVTPDNGVTWQVPPATNPGTSQEVNYSTSASDGDINIALGYVYAYLAGSTYGWSPNDSNGNSYYNLAANYIDSIRELDFNAKDPNTYNRYILADGSNQVLYAGGITGSWHPDYSDPRAYQLFQYFDSENAQFWESAENQTLTSWKAIFDFGSADPRTQQSPTTGSINFATQNSNLTNPTYGIQAAASYSGYTGSRYSDKYAPDSQRMPIRLLNYVQASENASNTDMSGIASSMLSALGTSFQYGDGSGTENGKNQITQYVPISPSPYANGGYNTQNFTAAGLLALAAAPATTWANKDAVFSNLDDRFGSTGMGSGASSQIPNNLTGDSGYNDALTLWALTVAAKGGSNVNTGLQTAVNNFQSSSSTSALATNDLTNYSGNFKASVFKSAKYGTDLNFYVTVGDKGGVRDAVSGAILLPGDANYTKIAQANIGNLGTFVGEDEKTISILLKDHSAKGLHYAPIATVSDSIYGQQIYFAFAAANPDNKEHFKLGNDRTLAFEDMYNLGDGDFNDIKISFSKA